jgi:hypothetical protein
MKRRLNPSTNFGSMSVTSPIFFANGDTHMPEVDFYMNEQDERGLIESILSLSTWLVPLIRYHEAQYLVIRDIAAYEAARQQVGQFLVLHDDWITSPLQMCEFTWQHDGKQYYFVRQRKGGPTLDLSLCTRYAKGDSQFLSSGELSYYPWYWNTQAEERQKPPDALKRAYTAIVKSIKENAQEMVSRGKQRYVISPGAARELFNGDIQLGGVPSDA